MCGAPVFFTKKDDNRFRTLVWKYVHMVKFERKT